MGVSGRAGSSRHLASSLVSARISIRTTRRVTACAPSAIALPTLPMSLAQACYMLSIGRQTERERGGEAERGGRQRAGGGHNDERHGRTELLWVEERDIMSEEGDRER